MIFMQLDPKSMNGFANFVTCRRATRNLQQLPNIAYSLALAHFYLGNQETADELLQNALIMFPDVLFPHLDKCSINTDSKVTSREFFMTKAASTTPSNLKKLQALYVTRSFHLWKESEILPWLEKQVHTVLQKVDTKDDYVKFFQVKKKQRYQGKLHRNILRHLIVSDLKDISVNIQEIQNEGSVLSHDPLPPTDSIDIYTNPRTIRRTNQSNSNILSLFFSSIFMDFEDDAGVHGANHQNENPGVPHEYD